MTCQHNYTTKQSRVPIKGGGPSQEILGELTFTVCLACEHVEGTFSSASLFNPKSEPIEAPDYDSAISKCTEILRKWNPISEQEEIHRVIFGWEDLLASGVVTPAVALGQIEMYFNNYLILERAKKR